MKTEIKKCVTCGFQNRTVYPMCNECMEKDGASYTASNFDLRNLSVVERQLVFLWACGKDITEYFDINAVPAVRETDDDAMILLSKLKFPKSVFWQRDGA